MATNPKFKDKYYLFSAIGGTGKVILSSVISRYRDDNGVLNVSSEGWKMVENLYSNGYVERGEEDWFGNLMSGKRRNRRRCSIKCDRRSCDLHAICRIS